METRTDKSALVGNYRGQVIDNLDPLKNGRCKVRVFGVHDDIGEDKLPWALFSDPFMGGLMNVGSTMIPEINAHVWCFFEGGDARFPVYFAGAPAMNAESEDEDPIPDLPVESREVAEDDANALHEEVVYPRNKVIKTKNGLLIEIDDKEEGARFRVKHPSGTEFLMDDLNFRMFHSTGNLFLMNDTEVKIETESGNKFLMNETEMRMEHVDGASIVMNADGVTDVVIGEKVITADDLIELEAELIKLGASASEPIALGAKLLRWLSEHTHPSPNGPTGTPSVPPKKDLLSEKSQVE